MFKHSREIDPANGKVALIPLISIGSKTAETFLSECLSKKSKGREPLLREYSRKLPQLDWRNSIVRKMNCFLKYKGHTPLCSSDNRDRRAGEHAEKQEKGREINAEMLKYKVWNWSLKKPSSTGTLLLAVTSVVSLQVVCIVQGGPSSSPNPPSVTYTDAFLVFLLRKIPEIHIWVYVALRSSYVRWWEDSQGELI